MDVATFGSTSSPCSAQFIKNRNAEEFAHLYPAAADAIVKQHYVDDYYDSVEEAVKLAKEVQVIHSKAGFDIRNWSSNSQEALKALATSKPASVVHFLGERNMNSERVLGLVWDTHSDQLRFSVPSRDSNRVIEELSI